MSKQMHVQQICSVIAVLKKLCQKEHCIQNKFFHGDSLSTLRKGKKNFIAQRHKKKVCVIRLTDPSTQCRIRKLKLPMSHYRK